MANQQQNDQSAGNQRSKAPQVLDAREGELYKKKEEGMSKTVKTVLITAAVVLGGLWLTGNLHLNLRSPVVFDNDRPAVRGDATSTSPAADAEEYDEAEDVVPVPTRRAGRTAPRPPEGIKTFQHRQGPKHCRNRGGSYITSARDPQGRVMHNCQYN